MSSVNVPSGAVGTESTEHAPDTALLLYTGRNRHRTLLAALWSHRVQIVECEDAEALVAAMEKQPFPLVLVDSGYPSLRDVLRRLRLRKRVPNGLVVVCLDAGRETAMPELVAEGVDDVLAIDGDPGVLESRIALLLKRLDHRRSWRWAERRLRRKAFHDELTGLANRAGLLDGMSRWLPRIRETPQRRLAVLCLDLDRLKVVNESLGQEAGDELLRQVGRRLAAGTRAGDLLARVGGDAFKVVTEVGLDDAEIEGWVTRLQEHLSAPFHLGSRSLVVAASIGIAVGDATTTDVEKLLRDASTAMFRAKQEGGGRHLMFDERMHAEAVERLRIETELRGGLERGELTPYMQPIFSLATGKLEAFEFLVRWRHPRRGLVAPQEFLPVAEETGLIVRIDGWMLERAWTIVGDWYARDLVPPQGITVSVNLSHATLLQADLVDQVRELFAQQPLDPARLALELTEGIMFDAEDGQMMRRIQALSELGVNLWIDDFGTGYSSLSQLHRLRRVDLLKIDRGFVSALAIDGDAQEIVRAIVALADALGRDSLAEGVETPEQRQALLDLGCGFGQGSLFSVPLTCDEAELLLHDELART